MERVNQFVIVDKDFDNVEDKFDVNVTPIQSNSFTSYSEILANAETIANPLTELVTNSVEPTKPKPQFPKILRDSTKCVKSNIRFGE